MKNLLLAILATIPLFCISLAYAADPKSVATDLQKILNGKHRSEQNKHRDQYRHPKATLDFFEVKPGMTVVEIWPGGGWYTEILAPYLRNSGKLYAAHFSADHKPTNPKNGLGPFLDKLRKDPKLYDKVEVTVLQPPEDTQIAPDGSADRVLTFRNVHNWMNKDQGTAVFNAMFNALKPGGILGVVEHRGPSNKPQDPKAVSGYVTEDYVIALARKAGFEYLAKSEINANSRDTKNYPEGVWTLPPALRLKENDKNKYLAIGESDRMTIKFIKPQPRSISSFLPKDLFVSSERANFPEMPTIIHNKK